MKEFKADTYPKLQELLVRKRREALDEVEDRKNHALAFANLLYRYAQLGVGVGGGEVTDSFLSRMSAEDYDSVIQLMESNLISAKHLLGEAIAKVILDEQEKIHEALNYSEIRKLLGL